MKKIPLLQLGLAVLSVMSFASCASSSSAPASSAPKVAHQLVLNQPITKVQKAAVIALTTIGSELKKEEPNYLEGHRPLKMGVLVGSGGETVKIWLEEITSQQTGVKVKTSKSMVGIAGQKNWDSEVLASIRSNSN